MPTTGEQLDEADEPMSLRAKVVAGAAVGVVMIGALLLVARMGSPAIPASASAPAGHYPLPCALCHSVTAETTATGTP